MALETTQTVSRSEADLSQNPLTGLWIADLTVRSAYQMGKSPLLPILAAGLGASSAYLGIIVSVSTLTGMFIKPLVGILSDRWGRRGWLILGTVFFAVFPFMYRFIDTPGQLLILRLLHGCGTAIYGPVTLAYVAEQSQTRVAERIGWFSLARSGGYILGPAVAGWLLLTLNPVEVFTVIGLISLLAFIPVVRLPANHRIKQRPQESLGAHMQKALKMNARSPILWLAGGIEAASYILLYAVKAFLPLYALESGANIAVVGGLFAGQELIGMGLKPLGGKLADRGGAPLAIMGGMLLLGCGTGLLVLMPPPLGLVAAAGLLGAAQALIFPASVAWLAAHRAKAADGGALGLLGALQNSGKIAGPILAGLLITRLDYQGTFLLLSSIFSLGALLLFPVFARVPRSKLTKKVPDPPQAPCLPRGR